MKREIAIGLALGATMIAGMACQEDPAEPSSDNSKDVAEYLSTLPTWDEFSPSLSVQPPTPIEDPVSLDDETLDVEEIDENGNVNLAQGAVYSCTSTRYSMTQNPRELVMYSPDVEILWPGALIQGRSHRDGLGSLLGVPIAQRSALQVSIPSLAVSDNFRTVEAPSQARVAAAIGSMVGNATVAGLVTPSTIQFQSETFHSEANFALSIGISGKYLGFKARTGTTLTRNAAETIVTAQFFEKMFEVVVAPPQAPSSFFSDDFSAAVLQEQIRLNRIGPDNIPVYVSSVVYGRMMMVSMTSTATADDIKATLRASFSGFTAGGSVDLSLRDRAILQNSKVVVTSLGGPAEATTAMIRSGDLSAFFSADAPLSSAAPISYTLRNLSDGSIAVVSETTEYNIKECVRLTQGDGSLLNSFETGVEGWTIFGGASDPFGRGGPAPGHIKDQWVQFGAGCIGAFDAAAGPYYYKAPGAYLGDKSMFFGGSLAYAFTTFIPIPASRSTSAPDIVLIATDGTELHHHHRDELAASTGSYIDVFPSWGSYRVGLDEASGWVVSDGTPASAAVLTSVLSNLSVLEISGETHFGLVESTRLDEVKLSPPTTVP